MTSRAASILTAIATVALATPAAAQCPDGSPPPCRSARSVAPMPASNTIAVLYFDNLSRDTADVYLADGLTEELIGRLTQVEALQVKSRTAVRRLRGNSERDPATLGRTLHVAQLLSGSVGASGGRLRVTVELTRAATGNTVWARSYDRPATDLFNVQAEIAESIAVNVGGRLAPAERQRIEKRPARNVEAYDHLLRGRFLQGRRTVASLLGAIREYEIAIRLDSTLTAALVGQSGAYGQLATLYYSPSIGLTRDSLAKLRKVVFDRAVRLDSTSAEVLLARAADQQSLIQVREWQARAVQAEPRNSLAHHLLALTLRTMGEDSAAIAEFHKAVELDPDAAISLINLGMTYYIAGHTQDAARWVDSALALQPDAAFFFEEHALVHLRLGDTATARASAMLAGNHGGIDGRERILGMLDLRRGDTASAKRRVLPLDSALAKSDCFLSHECLDQSYMLGMVGETERALALAARLQPRNGWFVYWTSLPEFDAIRSNPRFLALLREARERAREGGRLPSPK